MGCVFTGLQKNRLISVGFFLGKAVEKGRNVFSSENVEEEENGKVADAEECGGKEEEEGG